MMQYSLIGYVFGAAIILLLCAASYRILLESKISPSINRVIIILIYSAMIIAPLIVTLIPERMSGAEIEIGELTPVGVVATTIEKSENHTIGWSDVLSGISSIYFYGAILMTVITLFSIGKLFNLMQKSKIKEINGVEVFVHNNERLSTFSWNNRIFIYSKSLDSPEEEIRMLLEHEKAHLDRWHWIDLIVAQLVIIFQWFNPAAWYFRKELQRIHEYEADETVLSSGFDEKAYQLLLIRNISGNRYTGLTDGLNNCSLKKRIIMMKRNSLKKDWVIRGIAVCGFAILGGVIIHIPAVASVLTQPESTKKELRQSIKINGTGTKKLESAPVVYEVDGKETPAEEALSINTENIESITVNKSTETPKVEITTKSDNTSGSKVNDEQDTNVYAAVEKLAEYKGGQVQLMTDLAGAVVYPQEASDKGIQGRVVVKFQINTDGTVSNCQVLRGIDPLLDKEAISAVEKLSGNWIPAENNGNPVNSYFVLPVSFKLSSKDKESE